MNRPRPGVAGSSVDADTAALAVLLTRLYARFRSRGEPLDTACESAAALAADLLGCPLEHARAVMASVAVTGAHRTV